MNELYGEFFRAEATACEWLPEATGPLRWSRLRFVRRAAMV